MIEPFWHSPQMVGVLWGIVLSLTSAVIFCIKLWLKDRKRITVLEDKLKEFHNGITMAEIRAQHQDMHGWWKDFIRGRGKP